MSAWEEILDIARKVRRGHYHDNERADGRCFTISKDIEDNLKLENIFVKTVMGTFHGTRDEENSYFNHCWNEIIIGVETTLLDATGSQFDEITEDIIYGPYSKFPQYRK